MMKRLNLVIAILICNFLSREGVMCQSSKSDGQLKTQMQWLKYIETNNCLVDCFRIFDPSTSYFCTDGSNTGYCCSNSASTTKCSGTCSNIY